MELSPTSAIGVLAIVLAAALIGGTLAARLHQPVVLGYLVAGAVVGPYALGLIANVQLVSALAEVGVALLMFTLGAQVSLGELGHVGRAAVVGGLVQIGLTLLFGFAVGMLFGLAALPSAFLGAIVALSSTAVALRILDERGQIDSLHGRLLTGILIVQDLSVVPLIAVLPALAAPSDLAGSLIVALAKAAAILVAAYYVGTQFFPWLMRHVAALRSRELFLLTVFSLVLGTAIGVAQAGLSLALGAFIAGLVVSESEFSYEAIDEIIPLRDVFVALFFLSIGMLVNPSFLIENPAIVVALIAVIVIAKPMFAGVAIASLGYAGSVAVRASLGLGQIGEFSFVLVEVGVLEGILPTEFFVSTASVSTLTILLAPVLMSADAPLTDFLRRLPLVGERLREPGEVPLPGEVEAPSGHAVICGFGEAGRALAGVLASRGFEYFVIDYDPYVIAELRQAGVPCVYGDAANEHVLAQANLQRARVLALLIPDVVGAERAARQALRVNPHLDIIARAPSRLGVEPLRQVGVSELVEPDLEAGLEVIRHTLHRFGVSSAEAGYVVSRLRQRRLAVE